SIRKKAGERAAQSTEQRTECKQRRALVVVTRHFGAKRKMWDEVERQRSTHEDCEDGEPKEISNIGQPRRRLEKKIERNAERHHGRQHERMTASPARPRFVGNCADDRVEYGIETKRNTQRDARQRAGYADDLLIEKQHERVECGIFHSLRGL